MLSSNFRPIPTSVLSAVEGRKVADKVASLNEDLEELGFKISLVRVKKEQYMVLTDVNDGEINYCGAEGSEQPETRTASLETASAENRPPELPQAEQDNIHQNQDIATQQQNNDKRK